MEICAHGHKTATATSVSFFELLFFLACPYARVGVLKLMLAGAMIPMIQHKEDLRSRVARCCSR